MDKDEIVVLDYIIACNICKKYIGDCNVEITYFMCKECIKKIPIKINL